MSVPTVFFYISGHGFGHASRQIEIVNALGLCPRPPRIAIRTSASRWLFERTLRVPVSFQTAECDTGAVQLDSLTLDAAATIELAARFHGSMHERAEREAGILTAGGAALVVSDAPPLACAAATRAGVPSVVVSNFTWDWIYEEYEEHLSGAPDLLPAIRDAYRGASAAWRLPMHGGFEPFGTVVDMPFVARHAGHARDDVRSALELPGGMPLALFSFGGYGLDAFDPSLLDCLDLCHVAITDRDLPRGATVPPGVHVLAEDALYQAGFRYEDLVAAVDLVITKPGYGIIAECIANRTAVLYTSRGRFAEYDVLVREMPRYLQCGYIEPADLLSGRWRLPIAEVFASPAPPERPQTNGAEVIAERILQILER